MQNKANLYHGLPARGLLLSPIHIECYINIYPVILSGNEHKNKAKQSQFKPNFSPKLALFSPKLALFDKRIFAFANIPMVWLAKYIFTLRPLRPPLARPRLLAGPLRFKNPRLNNKYFYFTCCIFRLLCYSIANGGLTFHLSRVSLQQKTV